MKKSIEISQTVARAIDHTTWTIPKIRDGTKWRNINNDHLVANVRHVNGHDKYGNAIFRAKKIIEEKGWKAEITDTREECHEHLYYQHYRLVAWK